MNARSPAARKLGVRMHPKAAGLLRYGGDMPGAYLLLRGLFLPSELGEVLDDWDFTQQGLTRLNPIAHLANALKDGPSAPFGVVAAFESCFYLRNQLLRDTDWAGMAHSLEIRTPFIDSRLLCEAAPILARDDLAERQEAARGRAESAASGGNSKPEKDGIWDAVTGMDAEGAFKRRARRSGQGRRPQGR